MKRIVSIILALTLICCMLPTAFAASSEATEAADALHNLGLFNGTGTDANGNPIYDLDRAPSRSEAVTMLVRLLGKESDAKAGTWTTPFTDVQDWAKPYVGYAYANKLTSGTSATTFGGSSVMTATQYITLVLRALGYESGTDFQWDKAWELSDKIGMTDGRYKADGSTFLRGDVALISNNALKATLKGSDSKLFDTLNAQGFGAVKETSTVINGSGKPKYLLMDGKYYAGAELDWAIKELEYGGVVSQYVNAGNVFTLLNVITESYIMKSSNNTFFAGFIDKYGKIERFKENGGELWDMGDFEYAYWKEQISINTEKSWLLYRYKGNSCKLPLIDKEYPLNTIFFADGIKCFNEGSVIYVNLPDVLTHLGIDATITVKDVDNVGCVWSYQMK